MSFKSFLLSVAVLCSACGIRDVPPATPKLLSGEELKSCINAFLASRGLNEYGDPPDTKYAGGSPLPFIGNGQFMSREAYLYRKIPALAEVCPFAPGAVTGGPVVM
jgi:hypothetical protein